MIAALILVFSIAGYLQSNLRSENFSANPAVNNKMIIYFQHNRHTLESQSLKNLNLLAESLFQNPGMEINVKGYSDATGSYDYNLQISRKRANFIKSYLVQIGVNPYVINAHGLGP